MKVKCHGPGVYEWSAGQCSGWIRKYGPGNWLAEVTERRGLPVFGPLYSVDCNTLVDAKAAALDLSAREYKEVAHG